MPRITDDFVATRRTTPSFAPKNRVRLFAAKLIGRGRRSAYRLFAAERIAALDGDVNRNKLFRSRCSRHPDTILFARELQRSRIADLLSVPRDR
jgi:hypothetical protein